MKYLTSLLAVYASCAEANNISLLAEDRNVCVWISPELDHTLDLSKNWFSRSEYFISSKISTKKCNNNSLMFVVGSTELEKVTASVRVLKDIRKEGGARFNFNELSEFPLVNVGAIKNCLINAVLEVKKSLVISDGVKIGGAVDLELIGCSERIGVTISFNTKATSPVATVHLISPSLDGDL